MSRFASKYSDSVIPVTSIRAIDLAEFGPDALPIGLLGLRSVLNAGTAQSLNHQAGGVVRAGPDPSRRVPRDTLVFGRESLSRGTGAVEDHRRCSVQVLAEEAWTFFFLRFAREIAQEPGSRAAGGHHPRFMPCRRTAFRTSGTLSTAVPITMMPGSRSLAAVHCCAQRTAAQVATSVEASGDQFVV